MCFELAVWEKKRGEVGPSTCACSAVTGGLGRSDMRGGDAPVRGFLTGDGSITLSGTVCLDDDLLAVLRDRLISGPPVLVWREGGCWL